MSADASLCKRVTKSHDIFVAANCDQMSTQEIQNILRLDGEKTETAKKAPENQITIAEKFSALVADCQ